MRSGPGAARTILLFHIISARPSKQLRMVRTFLTFLKVYMVIGSYFLFLQEQIKDIIISDCKTLQQDVDNLITLFDVYGTLPLNPRGFWREKIGMLWIQ